MNTEERRPTSNFDTVDLLRGAAVLAVVLVHIAVTESNGNVVLAPGVPVAAALPLVWTGLALFRVFFPISGFLITLISIRRFGSLSAMEPSRFYRIRFARIAPMLLLVLLFLNAMHLAHVPGFIINAKKISLLSANVAVLTFHVNWVMAWRGLLPLGWSVLWSLSIEELFYFIFPLATIALRWRVGLPIFLMTLMGFIVAGPFARTILTHNIYWRLWSYLGSVDGIAMGCITALLVDQYMKRPKLNRRMLAGLQVTGTVAMLGVLIWPYLPFTHHAQGLAGTNSKSGMEWSVVSLATCMIIFASALRGERGSRWTEPLRWIGRRSYEIYLTHEIMIAGLGTLFVAMHRPGGATGGMFLSFALVPVTIAVGWFFARFYSEPLNLYLRDSFGGTKPTPRMPAVAWLGVRRAPLS